VPDPSSTASDDDHEIWERLATVERGMESPLAFEQWAVASTELERVLGPALHLAFVSLDYRQPHAAHELAKLIEQAYRSRRPGMINRDLARWTARALIDARIDLATACRMFVRIRYDGEDWVPTEFIYIDSEMDEIPQPAQYHLWKPEALTAKLAKEESRVQEFHRAALERAREMLG
jgi:hypothetical protein